MVRWSFISGRRSILNSRGFLLGLAAVLVPIMIVMAVAYQSHVRQEALRAHRVYWNDLVVKAAEGTAEEAFRWLIDHPGHPDNLIFARLRQTPSGSLPSTVSMNLDGSHLPLIPNLKQTFDGIDIISRVTLTLSEIKPLFTHTPVPPPGFNPKTQGQVYPDPADVFGLLKAEIEANYRGLKRKFVVVRDLKAINILPGVFSQFTLFVKEKRSGPENDWNKLRNSTNKTTSFLDSFGFVQQNANSLSNPITLIHSIEDAVRVCNPSEILQDAVSPQAPPEWSTMDLTKRGWVYLGRNQSSGPLQYYVFQPMHGDVKIAANQSGLPAGLPANPALYYGGTYMLADRSKLYYLLRDDSPSSPAWNHFFPANGGINIPSANLVDSTGLQLKGWMVWQSRFGNMSLTKEVLETFSIYHLVKNYYEHPQHLVGESSSSLESPHSSLLLPMGDMFPVNSTQIADRRSPTIMLGAWLRFLQTGNIVQIDEDIKSALDDNPPGDWQKKLESPANLTRPNAFYLPNFPINTNRQVTPPTTLLDLANDKLGWANFPVWAEVNDNTSAGAVDFAKVAYNVITHICEKVGDPLNIYEIVMTKMLIYPGMMIFEQMVSNNMRGISTSQFVPGGAGAGDQPLKLKNFPAELATVLQGTDANTGVPLPSSINGFGESFFYKNPDNTGNGRGISGECISVKDMNNRQLALGSLGLLWPFSANFSLPSSSLPASQKPGYDLRQKTTFLASSALLFENNFLIDQGGVTYLDLRGGVVTVLNDQLKLSARSGNTIICRNGGILIAADGDVIIEHSIKMQNPDDTLVIATAKDGKDIKLKPGTFEAYFISSGTIKREAAGAIKIFGGAAVSYLDFSNNTSSIFHGYPNSATDRQTIIWNKNFNVLDPDRYAAGMRIHLGNAMVYWANEKGDQP